MILKTGAVILLTCLFALSALLSLSGPKGLEIVEEEHEWKMLSGDHTPFDYYMWSHDSEKIAFNFNDGSTYGIGIVDVDSGDPVRITGTDHFSYTPFWHPDDTKIAYWEDEGSGPGWGGRGPNLYWMNSDGTDNHRLTSTQTVRRHSYAEGGDRILYFSCEDNMNGWFHLYSIDPDGTNNHMIANHGVSALMVVSADGQKAAYDGRPYWNKMGSIYIINSDGSDDHQVYRSQIYEAETGDFNVMSWSPDGTRLVFTDLNDPDREIYTIREDGTDLKKLTDNDYEDAITINGDAGQVWNPVTGRIVFMSQEHGNWDVFTMDPDGANIERITSGESDETSPLWSPDGSKISFISDKGGERAIYCIDHTGSGEEPHDQDDNKMNDDIVDDDLTNDDIGEDEEHDDTHDNDTYEIDPRQITEWSDVDNDGYEDPEDDFPYDPAASQDSDGDGYPDLWNPGMDEEDSTTLLERDAYPFDKERWEMKDDPQNVELWISMMVIVSILMVTTGFILGIIVGKPRKVSFIQENDPDQ